MTKLSLNMIVKNEETNLARALQSVKNVVDEIIIVDTGSTDTTKAIAKLFDAKVFDFEWDNNFSAARNFALEKSSGDWVIYLDADEELSKNSVSELKRVILEKPAGINCLVQSLSQEKNLSGVMKYPRVFPLTDKIRFTGRVHEQIQTSLLKNNFEIKDSSIKIIHLGYAASTEIVQQKLERNLDLLLREDDKKLTVYDLLKIGQTAYSLKYHRIAERYFQRMLNFRNADKKYTGQALMYLALINYEEDKIQAAFNLAQQAYKVVPDKPYLNFLLSLICLRLSDREKSFEYLIKAVDCNKSLILNRINTENEIVADQSDLLLRTIVLSKSLNYTNQVKVLIKQLAVYFSENYRIEKTIINKLITGIMNNEPIFDSEIKKVEKIITKSNLESFLELLKSYTQEDEKLLILYRLSGKFPDSSAVKKNLASHFEETDMEKSIEYYNEALNLDASDPAIYFHLISLNLQRGNVSEVKRLYFNLEKNVEEKPQIKQKVSILGKKLEKILDRS
jgi:glycosyltransferase involved in cell wall biosynthesis